MFRTALPRAVASTALILLGLAAGGCSSAEAPATQHEFAGISDGDYIADAPALVMRSPTRGTVMYQAAPNGGPVAPMYMSRGAQACGDCTAAADAYFKGGELGPRCDACGADRVPLTRAASPTLAH